MTFRGSIPSGQAYNGQHVQPQITPQLPSTQFPQYGSPYTDANATAHYQNQQHQYVQPGAYTQQPVQQPLQQPVQQYYAPQPPQQQYTTYDGSYDRPPPPTAPPVEFVNPSFLQQMPISALPYQQSLPPKTQPISQPHRSGRGSMGNSPQVETRRPGFQGSRMKSASPALPKKQGSVSSVTKSPSVSHASVQVDTLSLLICVAEDCFAKARACVRDVGKSLNPDTVKEYHKLIATGLGCLDVAMQSNKIWPRLEARIRLRYASILVEETTNYMEAETTLMKGINLCERHRLTDLKYCMQYLHVKVLFQRNPKAAFISVDTHISDCTTYKQVHWMYAFRFLKAAFYIQTGAPADPHAIDNLRKLAAFGNQRGDKTICVMASLLEALAHLRTMKDVNDAVLRVQTCIAQAAKYQLEDAVRLPQLDILLLLLNLACSLHQRQRPDVTFNKFVALQNRMEELKTSHEWDPLTTEVLLPIRKQSGPAKNPAISAETRGILREGQGKEDYIVVQALSRQQALALAFTFQGLASLAKSATKGRSSEVWTEGLKALQDPRSKPPATSLPEAINQADWEKELFCYSNILIGLQAATLSNWAKVKKTLQVLEETRPPPGVLRVLALYLSGVFQQGVANLPSALRTFESPQFDLDTPGEANRGHIEKELSILAALNRLWIMQNTTMSDEKKTAELLDRLGPVHAEHPDEEIRTAHHLVLATVPTNPPSSINQIKHHIGLALTAATKLGNTHSLAMALNLMRARLFESVVGDQAMKSAKAGAAQAKKSGNLLWMSVAEGMLAQTYEVHGQIAEARMTRGDGIRLANEAFAMTKC
ncbi:hypothetical protein CONLIGDRAFT_654231 [Coniochaeta ligniaria NRRL 30616]|uniref:Cohesin loading factor-domain-containing protein n=1 Tax=Coniochaeta ligniaria NRRL 30616 TaxID=1408157 RepID=A0A1J7IR04_9PEZI|nr:hypothetical protein CONLIGDRAFT_654231 [Coniochaeta ligniaria NRRL 30616]